MFLNRVARIGLRKQSQFVMRPFSEKTLAGPEIESLRTEVTDLRKTVTDLKIKSETMEKELVAYKQEFFEFFEQGVIHVGETSYKIKEGDSKSLGYVLIYDWVKKVTEFVAFCIIIYAFWCFVNSR